MNDIKQQINEIKNKVGQSAEDIIARGLGLQRKGSGYSCPNKIAHKRQDRNPSMGWHRDAMNFHCMKCEMLIDIYSYYREHCNRTHYEVVNLVLGEDVEVKNKIKGFREEVKNATALTDKCRKYINTRGINDETIDTYGLMSYKGNIAFPYYSYSTMIALKTRDLSKNKFVSQVEGGKPFLFGFQLLNDKDYDELIITEGEFDCMVVNQCGYTNVVSVGCGATALRSLFEQAKSFLNKYENLIILSDNDEAGEDMDEAFVKEFGLKARLVDKNLYTTKDINEEYYKNGKSAIDKLIDSARVKVEGRRDLDLIPYKGICEKTGAYIPTGIDGIDDYLNDLAPGCVTVIVGRTNAGKTTFTKQIITNAINKGNKVYCVTGEGDQEVFINEIYKNVIGKNPLYYDLKKNHKRYAKEPKKEVLEALREWHRKKLVLFSKGESRLKTMEQLFDVISNEIKIKRHNLVVIDNLMSLLTIERNQTKNDAQGEFIQQCCDIAKVYSTHIIVVVHPKKPDGNDRSLDIENISGSMDIGNKADNVIGLYRNKEGEEKGGRIKVLKNRYYSELPEVETKFDEDTGLLNEIVCNEEGRFEKRYDFSKWKRFLKENFEEKEAFNQATNDNPWKQEEVDMCEPVPGMF